MARVGLGAALALMLAGLAACTQHGDPLKTASADSLRATIYYLALESDYAAGNSVPFRDMRGTVLHRGSPEFKRAADIEGSAKLADGRVINFAGKVGGEVRWKLTPNPWGDGARCPLAPLRAAAVDPARVRLGSILLIEKTRGIRRPDGTAHDGIWYAVDTGGAIRGDRIDLFAGAGKTSMSLIRKIGRAHV